MWILECFSIVMGSVYKHAVTCYSLHRGHCDLVSHAVLIFLDLKAQKANRSRNKCKYLC